MRISEPAADLAAAAALCSSLFDRALPKDWVVFGEVALSGAIRPVNQTDARLKEAKKLGFSGALAPSAAQGDAIKVAPAATLADLVGWTRSQ
ncbi:MAG: magnesium chelatase domain-containing protein [Parvularculaceae bacterium]